MVLAPTDVADLLRFWFVDHGHDDWFGGGAAFDAAIATRYRSLYDVHRDDAARAHLTSPDVALAAILLFDQLPRNLFRDDARAFSTDPQARAIASGLLERGWDRQLDAAGRQFAYMPVMHAENLADQDRSVALFTALGNADALDFARKHRDIIARFGRFPHRNAALGRDTLPAERDAVRAGADW